MYKKVTANNIINMLEALIGPTEAVGDSSADERVMENLKALIDITNWCLDGVAYSADSRHRIEDSMRKVGQTAFESMLEWRNWLSDRLDIPDKIGEWVYDRPHHWECSNCHDMWGESTKHFFRYCPSCGSYNGLSKEPENVEITKCRDCMLCANGVCDLNAYSVSPDDFCSDGIPRRESV